MRSLFVTNATSPGRLQQQLPIRRGEYEGRTLVCLPDIVAFLLQVPKGDADWARLKARLGKEHALAEIFKSEVIPLPFIGSEGQGVLLDAAGITLALRIAALIDSPVTNQMFEHLAELLVTHGTGGHSMRERCAREGRSFAWTELRVEKARAHAKLKDEWRRRGVPTAQFARLVNIISSEALGLSVSGHQKFKNLGDGSKILDHCTKVELTLRLIGDRLARDIAIARNALGINEVEEAAREGGRIAGRFRQDMEKALGKSLVSSSRFSPRGDVLPQLPFL